MAPRCVPLDPWQHRCVPLPRGRARGTPRHTPPVSPREGKSFTNASGGPSSSGTPSPPRRHHRGEPDTRAPPADTPLPGPTGSFAPPKHPKQSESLPRCSSLRDPAMFNTPKTQPRGRTSLLPPVPAQLSAHGNPPPQKEQVPSWTKPGQEQQEPPLLLLSGCCRQ